MSKKYSLIINIAMIVIGIIGMLFLLYVEQETPVQAQSGAESCSNKSYRSAYGKYYRRRCEEKSAKRDALNLWGFSTRNPQDKRGGE